MKIEMLEAAPLRKAIDEITDLEAKQLEPVTRDAVARVRAIVVAAVEKAENPETGVSIEEFARLRQLTKDGARKQARKLIATGVAEKRGGRFIIFVNRLSA